MKLYIYFISLTLSLSAYCQVGINTKQPLGLFHIDGKGDSQTTGNYTDDIIMNNIGYIAFGSNITPTARIDITAPAYKGLILQDGTQKDKSLLYSEIDGKAFWKGYETNAKKIISNAPINYLFDCKASTGWISVPKIIPFPTISIEVTGNYIVILRFFGWRRNTTGATQSYDAGYFEFYVNGILKDTPEHYLVINGDDYFSFDLPFFFNEAKKGDLITFKLSPSYHFHWYINPNATERYKPSVILIKV